MISAIFLRICAGWFLYIFVDPSVDNKTILKKRNKQIELLKKIDKWNWIYNYNQLVSIVHEGIVRRYVKTPAQVLDTIYKKSVGISGISGLEDLTIEVLAEPEEIKKLPTYKDSAGNIYDSSTNQIIQDKNGNIIKQNKNFWKDLGSVIEWLVNILKSLGLSFNDSTIKPAPADWSPYTTGQKSEANIAGALPFVVGGVLLYYLFSTVGKKSGKSKKTNYVYENGRNQKNGKIKNAKVSEETKTKLFG